MALADWIVELQAAKETLLPELEGLRDFSRLNLSGRSAEEVQATLQAGNRRLDLLDSAINVLTRLQGDGYPTLPTRVVSTEVLDDLQGNIDTLEAAFRRFAGPDRASALDLSASPPVPK